MKLVFLYGRPAVGKLTVARELAALTGGRLFHNHLTVNLALSVYDFGTLGFIELRGKIWTEVFRRALSDKLPLLIFTFNPEDTVPQSFVDGLFAEFASAGAEVVAVELTAKEAEIEARLGTASRRAEGKTLSVEDYRRLRDLGAFDKPVITKPRISLDTGMLTPRQAAERIAVLL